MILIFKVILKFNVRLTLVLGYDSGTCWKKLLFFFFCDTRTKTKLLLFRKHTQLENKFRGFDAFQLFALMSNSTFQLSKARTTDLFKLVFFAT